MILQIQKYVWAEVESKFEWRQQTLIRLKLIFVCVKLFAEFDKKSCGISKANKLKYIFKLGHLILAHPDELRGQSLLTHSIV